MCRCSLLNHRMMIGRNLWEDEIKLSKWRDGDLDRQTEGGRERERKRERQRERERDRERETEKERERERKRELERQTERETGRQREIMAEREREMQRHREYQFFLNVFCIKIYSVYSSNNILDWKIYLFFYRFCLVVFIWKWDLLTNEVNKNKFKRIKIKIKEIMYNKIIVWKKEKESQLS